MTITELFISDQMSDPEATPENAEEWYAEWDKAHRSPLSEAYVWYSTASEPVNDHRDPPQATEPDVPDGACGEYHAYNGEATWIKDLDQKNPIWPLAYVWSSTTNRWRSKREKVDLNRVRLFSATPAPTDRRVRK